MTNPDPQMLTQPTSAGLPATSISGTATGSPPEPKTWAILATVGPFLKTTLGQVVAAAVGVLVAGVGVVLTPLNQLMSDWLWPEKIAIAEKIPATEKETAELRFILQVKNRAGFSGGSVTVSSPDNSIQLIGQPRFIVAKSEGTVTVPSTGTLNIRPLTAGTHKLNVIVESNRGQNFKGVLNVIVAPKVVPMYFGEEANWNGTWRATLNNVSGLMTLKEDSNNNLSGSFRLDGGAAFIVDPNSWHDGTAFLLNMRAQGQHIRARGFPCEVSDKHSKWRVLNGKVEVLGNVTSVPASAKLSSIIERCEKWEEKLTDVSGDGAFEARIRLK